MGGGFPTTRISPIGVDPHMGASFFWNPVAQAISRNATKPILDGNWDEFIILFEEYLDQITAGYPGGVDEKDKLALLMGSLGETDLREFKIMKEEGTRVTYPFCKSWLAQRHAREPQATAREHLRNLKVANPGKLKRENWRDFTTRFRQLWQRVPLPNDEEARDLVWAQVPGPIRSRLAKEEAKKALKNHQVRIEGWMGTPEELQEALEEASGGDIPLRKIKAVGRAFVVRLGSEAESLRILSLNGFEGTNGGTVRISPVPTDFHILKLWKKWTKSFWGRPTRPVA